jgi:hypothetical protein
MQVNVGNNVPLYKLDGTLNCRLAIVVDDCDTILCPWPAPTDWSTPRLVPRSK